MRTVTLFGLTLIARAIGEQTGWPSQEWPIKAAFYLTICTMFMDLVEWAMNIYKS